MINNNADQIARLAIQSGLTSTSTFKSPFAEAGFLMTYGADNVALSGRAAVYVDRILHGATAADLPVEEPRTFQFAVNLKTVQALGVTIPNDVAAQVTDWIQ
jgi:putative ABC transport system substrate-binding protein